MELDLYMDTSARLEPLKEPAAFVHFDNAVGYELVAAKRVFRNADGQLPGTNPA